MSELADICLTDGPVPADVERAEAALVDWIDHCERLHRARIQHDPMRCLVCFSS